MSINRNNYEEYFILYTDNELSADMRVEVERFVKENPDLAGELDMFCNTISESDVAISFDASGLLKEASFINAENASDCFVLYQDKELTGQQQAFVESFLIQHPEYSKLFNDLAACKFLPEEITFPGKGQLYKRANPGKLVPLYFWRAAAALLVLVFSIYIGGNNSNEPSEALALADTGIGLPPLKESAGSQHDLNNDSLKENKKDIEPDLADIRSGQRFQAKADRAKENLQLAQTVRHVQNSAISDQDLAIIDKPIKLAKFSSEETGRPELDRSYIPASGTGKALIQPTEAIPSNAVYREPVVQPKSENYVFYNITEEKFRESKVGKIFKKVKGAIRKMPVLAKEKIASI